MAEHSSTVAARVPGDGGGRPAHTQQPAQRRGGSTSPLRPARGPRKSTISAGPMPTPTRGVTRVVFGENDRVGPWIESHGGGEYRIGAQCIGLERGGELVAGALFDWFNGASICVHVAIASKRALNRDFLRAAFGYPFIQLGCEVLIGLVAEDNTPAQRFDEHLGFVLDSRIAGAHPSGALRVYTMRKHQCRWL